MLFFSPIFLFLFLPAIFVLFFASRGIIRDLVLLLGSSFFYFWAEPRFFPVVVVSTLIDFLLCKLIFKNLGRPKSKYLLTLGIVLNVLMLVYYKYMDFFFGNVNSILSFFHLHPLPLLHIALPIGVSFIVFEKITYLVDVYKKKGLPAHSIKEYFLYIFLFPKLLAGPIVKYHDIAAQLNNHQVTVDDFYTGFRRFLLGLIKKVLIADTIAQVADTIFGLPATEISAAQAWLGMICFSFQIYMDFSAYSDMAIGLARMFGFRLLENFNMPYISRNLTEFWQRWHISLSTWVRDYLYFPMTLSKRGRNKTKNKIRPYLNLFICFVVLGLWHGASWNYVLFGAYFGIFLIMDKLFWISISNKLPKTLAIGVTFFLILVGETLFRCSSISQFLSYLVALFSPGREGSYMYFTINIWIAIFIAALISFVPAASWYNDFILKIRQSLSMTSLIENWSLCVFAIFSMMQSLTNTFTSFLYFRF